MLTRSRRHIIRISTYTTKAQKQLNSTIHQTIRPKPSSVKFLLLADQGSSIGRASLPFVMYIKLRLEISNLAPNPEPERAGGCRHHISLSRSSGPATLLAQSLESLRTELIDPGPDDVPSSAETHPGEQVAGISVPAECILQDVLGA